MKLEDEIFDRTVFHKESLLQYGFQKKGDTYVYSRLFEEGIFEAVITISSNRVEGHCLDAHTEEEYMPLRMETSIGSYTARIKEEYTDILMDIRQKCTVPQYFSSSQANAVVEWIRDTFHEEIHFYKDRKETGFFSNAHNDRWYGFIARLDGKQIRSEGRIEVLTVKAEEDRIQALLQKKGFYPAYHMNKKHWISILLDGEVSFEQLQELLKISRGFTLGKKGKQNCSSWLIPSNPKYFDIVGALEQNPIITWRRHASIYPDHDVYLYVGKPYSAILYRFRVLSIEEVTGSMVLALKERYPETLCTLTTMRAHGVNTPRGARGMPEVLVKILSKK